ncbi:MAG: YHYH protein [Planctomycetota bacterium]
MNYRVVCRVFLIGMVATASLIAAEQAPANGGFKPRATIEVRGEYRYITSNGIPDHEPGKFPNPGNPNVISEQKYEFRVPVAPKLGESGRRAGPMLFGVALNGVPFDPGTAETWNGNFQWRFEAITGGINLGLDKSNAHVQPGGKYHYHALPTGLIDRISVEKQKMVLVGYAADGFPIYSQYGYNDPKDVKSGVRKMKGSYKTKDGNRPADAPPGKYDGRFAADWEYVKGLGDLDECNGRVGATAEYPDGIYHYYITEDYPFIPRQFKGEPDASFAKRDGPPGGGRGPGGRQGGGPPGGPGFGPPRGGPGGPGGPPPGERNGDFGGPGQQPPPLEKRDAAPEKPDPEKMLEHAAKLMEEAKRLTDDAAKLKAQSAPCPKAPDEKKDK